MSGSFRKDKWPPRWAVASPYLAQVERGVRPISKKIAAKLEVVFKVKPGTYTQVVFRRGRPPSEAVTRGALGQIRRATGKAPRALESVGPPKHPRADRVSGLEDPLWPIGISWEQKPPGR